MLSSPLCLMKEINKASEPVTAGAAREVPLKILQLPSKLATSYELAK